MARAAVRLTEATVANDSQSVSVAPAPGSGKADACRRRRASAEAGSVPGSTSAVRAPVLGAAAR